MSISYYARRLAALESKYKEAIESLQWYANIQSNCDLIEDGGDLAGRTLKYLGEEHLLKNPEDFGGGDE